MVEVSVKNFAHAGVTQMVECLSCKKDVESSILLHWLWFPSLFYGEPCETWQFLVEVLSKTSTAYTISLAR